MPRARLKFSKLGWIETIDAIPESYVSLEWTYLMNINSCILNVSPHDIGFRLSAAGLIVAFLQVSRESKKGFCIPRMFGRRFRNRMYSDYRDS